MKKSLSLNAAMSAFKTLMNIIFPLITFPYASNVLQVENLGKVNFASSVCGYFLLFAGLGISSYAVREGSRYVSDREKLSAFASEMFSINMISTALTYAALAATMLFWTKLHAYTDLMLVLSLQIFFTTIGTEWVFTIFEEYTYITIRGLLFQVLSIFMLFAFVKTRDDYCIYAGITVFAAVGANVLNFFRARRYCTIRLTRRIDWKKHLKPILIIFASTLATTLYVSSDTTILGILGTDYNVGIYSVAGKIYGIVKNLLSAVLVVSIPRLSHYAGVGDKANFNKLFNNIFNALIVVVAPAVVGLFALSREVVLFISGESYLDAVMPLQILSLALIVCLFGWLYNSCALLPCGREKELFWITLVSGLLNVGLNILLIPRFRENAAAFTTLLAELCSMILCIRCSKGLVAVSADRRTVGSVLCGCAGIVLVCTGVKALALPNLVSILAAVLGSVAAYAVILLGFGLGVVCSAALAVAAEICPAAEVLIAPGLNGQDPLRGQTLPAAGPFQKKRRFLVRSGKITTFLCFCNKCLLINYPSPVLAIHTLFVYNKDVRGSSQCAAPDEEQNSIPNEKNLRGVCYHGFR